MLTMDGMVRPNKQWLPRPCSYRGDNGGCRLWEGTFVSGRLVHDGLFLAEECYLYAGDSLIGKTPAHRRRVAQDLVKCIPNLKTEDSGSELR